MDQSDKRGPKKEKSKRKRTNERCPAQPVRKERSKGWCAKELASPQTAPEVRGRWTARIAARQVLHRLLLQKSTSPCVDSDMEKKSRKDIAIEKSKLQRERERERERKRERERESTNMIKPGRTKKIEIARKR